MCGIAGMIARRGAEQEFGARTAAMADALRHRGPDDHGAWNGGPAWLAHRRLSIIDLPHGHQPMTNEDGTLHLVFNGEIYNYRELMSDLKNRGHRFATRCDTEVILHAY